MRHLHLGLGRFHRAHQALYLQNAGVPITAFSMRSPTEAEALRANNHRYEVAILGNGSSESIEVSAIDEALFIKESEQRFLQLMASAEVRHLTLTVTEKGYCCDSDGQLDTSRADLQSSVLGWLVRGIEKRQQLHREPLHLLSCDNLSGNGRLLQRLCRAWGERFGHNYDEALLRFPNTMVDRIVPSGASPLLIETEAFHQWVIEDDFLGGRPRWEQPGLHFAAQVEPFEHLKLRLLNASHSLLAYYGQLRGHTYVHQAIVDPEIRRLVEKLYFEEVGPQLEIPSALTLEGYGGDLLRRFDNPDLPHKLAQIAMDGSQKLPQRLLPGYDQSEVLRLAVDAWFSYMWLGLSQRQDFYISDPLAESLKASMTSDFEQTAALWVEQLGWSVKPKLCA